MSVSSPPLIRTKLPKCVLNLDLEELGLLLMFLHKRFECAELLRVLDGLTKEVVEMRAEEIRVSDALRAIFETLNGPLRRKFRYNSRSKR
ncbi:Transducin family protein / WD-40 repeat family protein [Pyrus ussuriensis x Pyrus communis]|uniref:Transducin family protein / WD-40 repeat family protein n=1 Tax=Pyrus ussuriensis x Pyrus communis TaxID=2448454 RepID=A0A5N5IAC6_9ROSA|nr:Transducin family protein / WD-40 repeat family protein [Pyrus ussuriensis x Pyrus communis]